MLVADDHVYWDAHKLGVNARAERKQVGVVGIYLSLADQPYRPRPNCAHDFDVPIDYANAVFVWIVAPKRMAHQLKTPRLWRT